MIITIDGPSGTGKSTVAKGVAQRLGFTFFDTGAMYRSMAWWLSNLGVNLNDQIAVKEKLPLFRYEIKEVGVDRKYFANDIDVSEAIRTHSISGLASTIAAYPDVRKALVHIQRKFGAQINAVFEGRDMGTVVFPDAEVKFFLTANSEVRAQRRYLELKAKNPQETRSQEQILQDIEARDHHDSTREASPLKQAADAVLLDTSHLTAEQAIQNIVNVVKAKM